MSVMIGSPLFLSSAGYQISRSVRLRANTGYLNRTFGASGSTSQWTYSVWTKRGTLGSFNVLLSSCITGSTYFQSVLAFDSSDRLWYYQFSNGSSYAVNVTSTAVFRDPSAWYHVVMKFDATTSSMIVWVNNQQVINSSSFSTTNRLINSNNAHYIGNYAYQTVDPGEYDGYFTEINFIDGQALTPSSFGETNPVTGVWQPIKYTGTYGTNGFYLNFSDNSAATATTIGKDYSGNGNNWTPNNISLTAGATYDSMLDVPTQWADGGNGRGNYCVLNPLDSAAPTLVTNGNLQITANSDACGTMSFASGKWYFEVTRTDANASNLFHYGLLDAVHTAANRSTSSFTKGILYRGDGVILRAGSTLASGLAAMTQNKVLGVAFDMDAKTVQFYVDNVAQSTAQTITDTDVMPWTLTSTNSASAFNAGQRPFAYTPPTGFKALNTLNLPTPTILKGNQYFDATLWTGTGAILSVTNSGAMQPDLVWIKQRSAIRDHRLTDSVRGANKQLFSNTTGAETSNTDELTAFNSNGFTLSTSAGVNANAGTYVGWQWNAGGTPAVTNTAGSITSQVSAGGTQGFSVATFTSTGASATVGHGLGVAPSMIILKSRNNTSGWNSFHISLGNTQQINLQSTAAATSSIDWWRNTSPTSTVFTIGANFPNTYTWVAYCFAPVAGYSAFGSYTGNGSADGPFVFLGFRPRFVMFKRTDSTGSWFIEDSSRGTYNVMGPELYAESSAAEATASRLDFLSNGFKMRAANAGDNASGGTYIYAAFAENPFKNALAR